MSRWGGEGRGKESSSVSRWGRGGGESDSMSRWGGEGESLIV